MTARLTVPFEAHGDAMVKDEIVDVLFVVKPYRADLTIPRAFVLRVPPDGMTELNNAIDTGLIRSYRVMRKTSGAEYVAAVVTRSPYGFIQMELM